MRLPLIYCNTIMKMLITEIYSEIILDKTIVSENIQWEDHPLLREPEGLDVFQDIHA